MKKRTGVTMVEVFVMICLIGIIIALLLLPAIQAVREAAKRKGKDMIAIKGIENLAIFKEFFGDEPSEWIVSETTMDGLKPIVLIKNDKSKEAIVCVKEDLKGDQILVNGKLWPKDTPVSTIFAKEEAKKPLEKKEGT